MELSALVEGLRGVLAEAEVPRLAREVVVRLEEAGYEVPRGLTVEELVAEVSQLDEKKLPPGFKMVFGRLVKAVKSAGGAIKRGAGRAGTAFVNWASDTTPEERQKKRDSEKTAEYKHGSIRYKQIDGKWQRISGKPYTRHGHVYGA